MLRPAVASALLALGSTIFLVVGAEIVSRLVGYRGVEQYRPDEELGWVLAPRQSTVTSVGRLPVRINSEGFRDDSLINPKPAGAVRIFALGASSTFGWGVRQEEAYHQVLERMLNDSARAAGSAARFEIVNAGVIGYNLWQVKRLMRRIAARYQPDGFIVAYTFNDAWNRAGRLGREEREKILNGVRRKNLLRKSALFNWLIDLRARRLARQARARSPEGMAVAQTGDTTASGDELAAYAAILDSMIEFTRRARLSLAFMVPAARGSKEPTPRQRLMATAGAAAGVPVLDLTSSPERQHPDSLYLADDAVHPTANGHAIIARLVYANLCAAARAAPRQAPVTAYRAGCGGGETIPAVRRRP